MPVFPSEAWCRAAVALAEADPEFEAATRGFSGDVGVAVLAQPPNLPAHFVVSFRPEGARIAVLGVGADLDALEASLVARAPYSVWKALLQGVLDPLDAVLGRQVDIQGDLQPLIARVRFGGLLERVLAGLQTRFIDDEDRP